MSLFSSKWNPWQDAGIEYITGSHEWVIIQTRTRKKDNFRQSRHVQIMKHGGQLSDEVKNRLNEIIAGRKEVGDANA